MKKVKVVYTTLRVEVPLNKNPNLLEYWLKGSPIFSEFMENSAKFMKNSGLTASSSESLPAELKLHIKSMYFFQYFAGLESTFGKNTVFIPHKYIKCALL